MDRADLIRRTYLEAVCKRMADPDEDRRIRTIAQNLLEMKLATNRISAGHAERWKGLLALSTEELSHVLLADGEHGREMRHAHLFAGCLPAHEANRIQSEALRRS